MTEFENTIKQPFAQDIKELGLEPISPLQYRLRKTIAKIDDGWNNSDLYYNGFDL